MNHVSNEEFINNISDNLHEQILQRITNMIIRGVPINEQNANNFIRVFGQNLMPVFNEPIISDHPDAQVYTPDNSDIDIDDDMPDLIDSNDDEELDDPYDINPDYFENMPPFEIDMNEDEAGFVEYVLQNAPRAFLEPVHVRLSKDQFDAMPVSVMSKKLRKQLKDDEPCCPICMENIKTRCHCTVLPCGHVYHKNCARKWLTEKCERPTCPMCRADVRTKYV